MRCQNCGYDVIQGTRYCNNCGSVVNDQEKNLAVPDSNSCAKDGKTNRRSIIWGIAIVSIVILFIAYVFIQAGKGSRELASAGVESLYSYDERGEKATSSETSRTNSEQDKYVEKVLTRKLYFFKDEVPEMYTQTVNMEKTVGWVDDWTLGDILSTKYFTNIAWEVSPVSGGTTTSIVFRGESIELNGDFMIAFLVNDEAERPEPLVTILGVGDQIINAETFLNSGVKDVDIAMMMPDVMTSIYLAMCSSECMATKKANNTTKASSSGAQSTRRTSTTYESNQTTPSAEYVLPDSSTKYLSKADLRGLDASQCRIARNEIYARHGRMFRDDELQNYFNNKSWYRGYIAPGDFAESLLNDYEVANRDLIVEYEKEQGYR